MKIQIKIFFFFSILLFYHNLLNANESNKLKAKNECIDVLYFHATVRCEGCLRIEEFINQSINYAFKEELKDSTIKLKSLDFLQPENEHFQDDYKFDVQSLILSKKIDGKEVEWKNLDSIWDLDGDFGKFEAYVEREVRNFINK
ncbi:MAG: nitrophenyl compound nitroreductase subunit ArsF family protein [Candidatus Kapaibacteriota bacterium]